MEYVVVIIVLIASVAGVLAIFVRCQAWWQFDRAFGKNAGSKEIEIRVSVARGHVALAATHSIQSAMAIVTDLREEDTWESPVLKENFSQLVKNRGTFYHYLIEWQKLKNLARLFGYQAG